MTEKKPFLQSLHYFRGFAIINIMIAHVWTGPSGDTSIYAQATGIIDTMREVFFHNSTIYFIFVSGFLAEYLSATRNPLRYYRKKFLYIILPYIIMSSLWFFWSAQNNHIPEHDFLTASGTYLSWLTYGQAQIQYWYIPFIAIIFVISPMIFNIPHTTFKWIVAATSLLPLLGTRTATDITIFQFIYFLPVYLQGIYAARNYDTLLAITAQYKIGIVLLIMASTGVLVFSNTQSLSFGVLNFSESMHYIQKAGILLIVLSFFEQRSRNAQAGMLDLFASYSFALYFTHVTVSMYLVWKLLPPPTFYSLSFFNSSIFMVFIASILYLLIKIVATLLSCMIAKKITGRFSRFLIGA
ncbi:acyltransferase family protein [Prosthecochloris sp. CIB 2401]|uniref:acyltransferase family protein n=1 Tax=Prosthecochloris sp. CIB 2401 TaxID=1868325 RepID=UPI00080A96B2|nr:acyltransferase [Prosthecochloris sp. CIB 2401]ANT64916.1 putative membrane protein [Prosthecochloris sp. CIB 2401]